jgi:hypothetical protein
MELSDWMYTSCPALVDYDLQYCEYRMVVRSLCDMVTWRILAKIHLPELLLLGSTLCSFLSFAGHDDGTENATLYPRLEQENIPKIALAPSNYSRT